jgi:hypothetical protein
MSDFVSNHVITGDPMKMEFEQKMEQKIFLNYSPLAGMDRANNDK